MHLSFGREVQEVASMASIAAKPRKIGKENMHYICDTLVGLSWRNLVCEGLSGHTVGAGAAGATIIGGTVNARVQVMAEVIIILWQST